MPPCILHVRTCKRQGICSACVYFLKIEQPAPDTGTRKHLPTHTSARARVPMPFSTSTCGSHGPSNDWLLYTVVVHAAALPPGHVRVSLLQPGVAVWGHPHVHKSQVPSIARESTFGLPMDVSSKHEGRQAGRQPGHPGTAIQQQYSSSTAVQQYSTRIGIASTSACNREQDECVRESVCVCVLCMSVCLPTCLPVGTWACVLVCYVPVVPCAMCILCYIRLFNCRTRRFYRTRTSRSTYSCTHSESSHSYEYVQCASSRL